MKQKVSKRNEIGGYVKIQFLESYEDENGERTGWKEVALEKLLCTIKELLAKKYSYKDICILVRRNADGNEIANWLFQNGIEEIISPDSLLITASPRIVFLINIFCWCN